MEIVYRKAVKSDAPELAKISLMAAGGTFELLLQGLKRNVKVESILQAYCESEDTEYSYHNYFVAEVDGKVAGAVNYISVADRYKLSPNINPLAQAKFGFGLIQLVKFLIRARRLRPLNTIKSPKDALHINDIANFPEYRGLGIGKKLVNMVIEEAKKRELPCVSLYVWMDNKEAIEFYKHLGFTIQGEAFIKPHRKYLNHPGSYLMTKSI